MQKSKTSQPLLNIASKGILLEPDQDMTTETSPSDLDLQVTTKVLMLDVLEVEGSVFHFPGL